MTLIVYKWCFLSTNTANNNKYYIVFSTPSICGRSVRSQYIFIILRSDQRKVIIVERPGKSSTKSANKPLFSPKRQCRRQSSNMDTSQAREPEKIKHKKQKQNKNKKKSKHFPRTHTQEVTRPRSAWIGDRGA